MSPRPSAQRPPPPQNIVLVDHRFLVAAQVSSAPRRPDGRFLSGRWLPPVLVGLAVISVLLSVIVTHRRLRRLRGQLERAQHRANHDPLTGLPNRHAALTSMLTNPPHLVGLLDLDGFKRVNDTYGHHIGDQLLVTLAHRLQTAMAGQGTAARLGGDEFLLLWTQPAPDPLPQGTTVLDEVCAPITLGGRRLTPRASLGLARPHSGLSPAEVIALADGAMYDAKRASRRAIGLDGDAPGPRIYLNHATCPPTPPEGELLRRRARRDRPIDEAPSRAEEGDPR